MLKILLIANIILLNAGFALADDIISVLALFKDKVVIQINNQHLHLKVGGPAKQGIKLISASSHNATIEVNGVRQDYRLGDHIESHYSSPTAPATVMIAPKRGMYFTQGSINGFALRFLVDTGASNIAINSHIANRIGLNYSQAQQVAVSTAAGIVTAYRIDLAKVTIGEITLYNVTANVLEGDFPEEPLLGMSFLGQLTITHDNGMMLLKQNF